MQTHASGSFGPRVIEDAPRIAARRVAAGADWAVGDYLCRSGPDDRPYEERHEQVTIAAVIAGSFSYRTDQGRALLYPGALMLGNAGVCFECGHEHGIGDRCIAFHLAPSLFEEIAAGVTGSSRFRFPAAMLPANDALAPALIELETAARAQEPAAVYEVAVRLAEKVVATVAERRAPKRAPSASDRRRVANALRHIDDHADAPLMLDELAAVACMSKYHFLRTFRRVTEVTPYQYLLGVRLRRAALRLRSSAAAVSTIALDAGFGDLSTFNGRFRDVFGSSPSAYRRGQPPKAGSTGTR